MCGIIGVVGGNRNLDNSKLLETIKHRGKDSQGYYSSGDLFLGHSRLSIIDLSKKGNQPITSKCKNFILIFNGEIYNYREIRRKYLSEIDFYSNTDSEVLLELFIKFGVDSFSYLNGMFAFAIYDKKKDEIILSRDRLGIKPLYYSNTYPFIFCSEIKPIIKLLSKNTLSVNSIQEFFNFQTNLYGNTLVEEINFMSPGTYLIFDIKNRKNEIKKYWSKPKYLLKKIELPDLENQFKNLFLDSIDLRLKSDVDFGIFLSGGIDSSILTAAASNISEKKLNTISVVPDDINFDESDYSKFIAKKFNTKHHEVSINGSEIKKDYYEFTHLVDYPSVDSFNNYIVTKKAKEIGLKMSLSGLGGDELFAGYPLHHKSELLAKLNLISPQILKYFISQINKKQVSRKWNSLLAMLAKKNLTNQDIVKLFRNVSDDLPILDNNSRDTRISKNEILRLDFEHYTEPILLRDVDNVSMRNGIEVRVPFLDHRIVELMWGSWNYSSIEKYPKQTLVNIFHPWIPEKIANRKKMGFTLPWSNWINSEFNIFFGSNIQLLADNGIISKFELKSLKNDLTSGSKNWVKLMKYNQLSIWLQDTGFF